jgi:hypothetical protein
LVKKVDLEKEKPGLKLSTRLFCRIQLPFGRLLLDHHHGSTEERSKERKRPSPNQGTQHY